MFWLRVQLYFWLLVLEWNLLSSPTPVLGATPTRDSPELWHGALPAVLVLMAAAALDWLIVKTFKRSQPWLERHVAVEQHHWLDLVRSLVRFIIRLWLWLLTISWVASLIPALKALKQAAFEAIQRLLTNLYQFLATPLFEIGKHKFSLGSLFFFVFVALSVFVASHAFSQWIKRRILMRMRLHRGTQEAIAAVIGYALAGLSFVIVLQTAGIDLGSLTVLAGVLGLGFGFGFQNLASNFISGLTLLFEQPIKAGDFIEVDGLLGTVESISIRSTVIRTQDAVFVIVPNNRFIEKNVVNWSYREPESRIHIPVGVAHGSDTLLVTEALLTAARMDTSVLLSPAPQVWFKRFGDSVYEFELLVWINQPQNFDSIKSSLNFLIEQELYHRGIEIPFPQRDLRIRNLEELGDLFGRENPLAATDGEIHRSAKVDLSEVKKSAVASPKSRALRVLLRKVTYFEQCSDVELRLLIELGYQKFFPSKQLICCEGEPGNSFFMILSGSVEVFSEQIGQTIATLQKGNFFGEISLLTGMPRSATVRALEDTILFIVDHNALQKLLQDYPELAEQIAQALSQRQQVLRDLGLLEPENLNPSGDPPLVWIRRRMQTLFGI
jgi:small-conductance mechanosensitive channel